MYCPVCKTVELKISDRNGVEIDYCPQCRGVWLDRGELDKIIERTADYESRITTGNTPRDEVVYEKRKNDEYVDYDRYDDDYDERRKYDPNAPRRRKRSSFLGEIFDIFD